MSEGKKEILLGDCLELMKDIPNGRIDAIITDPPYTDGNINVLDGHKIQWGDSAYGFAAFYECFGDE